MDLTADMVVAEQFARDGSFGGWHGAHAGIATLPLLLFGTDAQKKKYLPKLSSAETVGAYCLSEPQAGSDALAAQNRADSPSPDGTHYILNGQKMWITNGGKANLFTVFAKVNGEQFTAFLVERGYPAVYRTAPKKKKMGIKGSSTTPIFDNVPVPVENVLGEIVAGHIIAFNILNVGRLKLGAFAAGGSKNVLAISSPTRRFRKAFGTTISRFGMIQHKLAENGDPHLRRRVDDLSCRRHDPEPSRKAFFSTWNEPDAARRMMKAVEEFAAECSIIKVYASEVLDYVVDEGVQIHGGYGYHQDYAVERSYRDSRINRIFEGTNEINRLLVTGMLLKQGAQQGRLGLVKAAKALMDEILFRPVRQCRSGVEREEDRASADGGGVRKIRHGTGETTGSGCGHRGRHHGNLRDGIRGAAFAEEPNRGRHLRGAAAGCNGPNRAARPSDSCGVRGRRCPARQHGDTSALRKIRTGRLHRAAAAHRRTSAQRGPVCDLNPRVILAVGLPGSGKSTYFDDLKVNPISSDSVRLQLGRRRKRPDDQFLAVFERHALSVTTAH